MSEARKLARNMARASSLKKIGYTDLFKEEFQRIWREECGHPKYSNKDSATKTHFRAGKRTGVRRRPLTGRA